MGQFDGQLPVFQQPFDVAQGMRDTFEEMLFALKQSPEAIGSQNLNVADQHVAIVMLYEPVRIDRGRMALQKATQN